MIVTVLASMHFRDGRQTDASGLTAQLWDGDPISDDLLATAVVTGAYPDFAAEFVFDLNKAASPDSPLELQPDLYILIEDAGGREVFRSKVYKDVSFWTAPDPGQNPVQQLQMKFVQA